jgi:hypothetical protein
MLGAHTEQFDLHEWFFTLDAKFLKSGEVVPQRDGGKWLQEQTMNEARRRGLPFTASLDSKTASTLDALSRFAARGQK